MALAPDGRRAVSASYDDTLKVWDLESGQVVACFSGDAAIRSCDLGMEGNLIVAGDAAGMVHFLRLEGV